MFHFDKLKYAYVFFHSQMVALNRQENPGYVWQKVKLPEENFIGME
jgi:hypothetical protein